MTGLTTAMIHVVFTFTFETSTSLQQATLYEIAYRTVYNCFTRENVCIISTWTIVILLCQVNSRFVIHCMNYKVNIIILTKLFGNLRY